MAYKLRIDFTLDQNRSMFMRQAVIKDNIVLHTSS